MINQRNWREQAACRPGSGFDPEWWFGVEMIKGSPDWDDLVARNRDYRERAKLVCSFCPVRGACLAEGLNEPHGIWGGYDEDEREQIKAGKPVKRYIRTVQLTDAVWARRARVLDLVLDGRPFQDVADELGISVQSVVQEVRRAASQWHRSPRW